MAKLVLSMDGLVLKEIGLAKERMTIGRRPSNDIQIDNLAISGEHAAVVTILNDSFLEDLNSTNGTLVNGQTIKKHFLKNGDIVELGKYKLKYITEQPSPGDADYDKTMVLRPGALNQVAALAASASNAAGVARATPATPAAAVPAAPAVPAAGTQTAAATSADLPRGAIQVLNGANAGRELELVKSLTTLGKPGKQVAVIARRPYGYFITHVEGASFPAVNGQTLDAQAHLLKDHDVIEISGIKMEFFLRA